MVHVISKTISENTQKNGTITKHSLSDASKDRERRENDDRTTGTRVGEFKSVLIRSSSRSEQRIRALPLQVYILLFIYLFIYLYNV